MIHAGWRGIAMSDIRKETFRTVKTDAEEIEQKIRKHRLRVVIFLASAVIVVSILVASAGIYFAYQEYEEYEVRGQIERNDSEATKYEDFSGNILRYNNDGAFYADMSDRLIWNQAYEMQNPAVNICGDYAVIADMQGTQIYIMSIAGMQGQVETNYPIEAVCIAKQGTIAVLTQENGTSYLELYNKGGENLASGEIHVTNSGYPLDIALSYDANKLAVSILDISKGKARTAIAFYNFGSVGQNEIDHMVASYAYDDLVIPQIRFVSNNRMVAFGDTKVILFEGVQKPEEAHVLTLERDVKSVFFDEEYFGLVFDSGGANDGCKLEVYDMNCGLVLEREFSQDYQDIGFLQNHEICIRSEYACEIYTLRGVKKFQYNFDDRLYQIFSGGSGRRYTFILEGMMQRVRLK